MSFGRLTSRGCTSILKGGAFRGNKMVGSVASTTTVLVDVGRKDFRRLITLAFRLKGCRFINHAMMPTVAKPASNNFATVSHAFLRLGEFTSSLARLDENATDGWQQ